MALLHPGQQVRTGLYGIAVLYGLIVRFRLWCYRCGWLTSSPRWVSREADDASLEATRLEIETVLNRLTDQANDAVRSQQCHVAIPL